MKSAEVSDTSILSTRQTRFRDYDGRPLKYTLLFEHESAHRKFNHAVVLELPEALHSAEAFDAWQVSLDTTAGTRETYGTARGWRRMVDDSRRLDVQQRASSRKACPLCTEGECGPCAQASRARPRARYLAWWGGLSPRRRRRRSSDVQRCWRSERRANRASCTNPHVTQQLASRKVLGGSRLRWGRCLVRERL